MLSESILADLTRQSPLQPVLVTAAWPALSTESRLQIIDAVQGCGVHRNTPGWLLDLAQDDPNEIVRYWAVKAADFPEMGGVDSSPMAEWWRQMRPPDDANSLERAERARSDPSELVRQSVDLHRLQINVDMLNTVSQRHRLMAMRNLGFLSLYSFVEWLGLAIEANVSDADLGECAAEYFARPDVVAELKKDEFDDGMTAHLEGKAITEGWQLLREKAGPRLTTQLAYALPTKRGLGRMKAADFVGMPEQLLRAIIRRSDEDQTCAELVDMISAQPERFPPDVVKLLNDDMGTPGPAERAEYALRHSIDRHAATLSTVIEIRRDIKKLQERLDAVYEAASRKRGLFG
jgi:hypothetical protein